MDKEKMIELLTLPGYVYTLEGIADTVNLYNKKIRWSPYEAATLHPVGDPWYNEWQITVMTGERINLIEDIYKPGYYITQLKKKD